jgi:two-component system, NtrC family, response regulator
MDKRLRMTKASTSRQPPIVSLSEVGDNLLVQIELSGVKIADVDVSISDDALIIRQGKATGRQQHSPPAARGEVPGIVGSSPRLQACLELARQAAANEANVLIGGEAGTGKELLARFIHAQSQRADGTFVVVDCTAVPAALMETLLFGPGPLAAGAIGAAAPPGLIRQAQHGTLFFDEISELPYPLQQRLRQSLHQRHACQNQDNPAETCDFRLIAATRRNLLREEGNGRFCHELLQDLRACVINLPPLRERTEDLGALTRHFIDTFCRQHNLPGKHLTPEFLLNIAHYGWPGNVHELSNVLEQAIFLAQAETTLFPKHLPVNIRVQATRALWQARHAGATSVTPARRSSLPKLQDMRENVFSRAEQEYLHNLVTLTGRNIEQACELSGLSRSRLYTLLKKHQIISH